MAFLNWYFESSFVNVPKNIFMFSRWWIFWKHQAVQTFFLQSLTQVKLIIISIVIIIILAFNVCFLLCIGQACDAVKKTRAWDCKTSGWPACEVAPGLGYDADVTSIIMKCQIIIIDLIFRTFTFFLWVFLIFPVTFVAFDSFS